MGWLFWGEVGGRGCFFVFWWVFFSWGVGNIFVVVVCLLLESMIIFKSEFVGDH